MQNRSFVKRRITFVSPSQYLVRDGLTSSVHIGASVSIAAKSHRLNATIFLRSRCAVR